MRTFILSVEPTAGQHTPTDVGNLFAEAHSASLPLLRQVWLLRSADSVTTLEARLMDLLGLQARFVLTEASAVAAQGVSDRGRTVLKRLDMTGIAAPEPEIGLPSSLAAHATEHVDPTGLRTYVAALEEELATLASRYGLSDKARDLLSRSPFR